MSNYEIPIIACQEDRYELELCRAHTPRVHCAICTGQRFWGLAKKFVRGSCAIG
jgi:hypothetical protein